MNWTSSLSSLPPNKTMVEVFHRGEESIMWYESGLWFFEDRSMYVYYLPEYWRAL